MRITTNPAESSFRNDMNNITLKLMESTRATTVFLVYLTTSSYSYFFNIYYPWLKRIGVLD